MSEQGSPQVNQAAIMVAAGAQDERAIALVQAMRQAGLRVTFAETVNIAVRASEVAACVVVLRPDTWKTQAIATVMRTKPDCLIPVLAETMELPRGPWTHPAIQLADDPVEGQQQVIQVLYAYLETHKRQARTAPSKSADLVTINQLLHTRKRRQRRPIGVGSLITTFLLIVIVGLGGLLGYRYYTSGPSRANATAGTPGTISGTAPLATYNAATPGQYCDGGGGSWSLDDRYVKTVNKQKAEITDKYTTQQCQSRGALLTRSDDYNFYSEIFFYGINAYSHLAQHYTAQVDATIAAGDTHADIDMEVHDQDQGYGRYRFDVNTLGHWEANITSTTDGFPLKRLAIGFLPKGSKTYTLKVEVNGSVMKFWIDGKQAATIADTTYTGNDFLGFGMSDWSTKTPISAVFSNFKYAELTPGQLDNTELEATATAQAKMDLQTPYTARIPGYGCDTGAGQWQPLADKDEPGTLNCLANGMQLSAPASEKSITSENFYWLNGQFPQNYKVSAQVDVGNTANVCASLGLREDKDSDRYAFTVCADGSWEIDYLSDTFRTLAQGNVQKQSIYTITAQAEGSALSMSINNQLLKTVNDAHLTTTDHLSLFAGYYRSSQDQHVTFSNFVFTPLP